MSTGNPLFTQGFHHIALRANDFDQAVAFYHEVLGLPTKIAWGQAPERAIMLESGIGQYIEIFERPDGPILDRQGDDTGDDVLIHFALRTHDLDAALKAVQDVGCEITMPATEVDIPNTHTDEDMPAGIPVKIAFFRGPCGEHIELFENALT